MTSCHIGVIACLKSVAPSSIGVHCTAHRLNLDHRMLDILFPTLKSSSPRISFSFLFISVVLEQPD